MGWVCDICGRDLEGEICYIEKGTDEPLIICCRCYERELKGRRGVKLTLINRECYFDDPDEIFELLE